MLGALRQWILVTVAVVVVLTAGLFGCAKLLGDTDESTKASPEMVAFIDEAMPKLARITRLWRSGDLVSMNKAADLYLELSRDVPALAGMVAEDFAAYAKDVGYYLGGDGSVNLKQLDDSRRNAEESIAGSKLP